MLVLSVLLTGISIGFLYGLAALGVVLVYRGSRVLNFAQGEFGTVGIYAAWLVASRFGPFLGLLAGACTGALVAAAVERVAIRPANRMGGVAPVVATSAVTVILIEAEKAVFGVTPRTFTPPIRGAGLSLASVFFSPIQLLTFAIACLVSLALYLFFRRTWAGLAVLAQAHNSDTTRLLGIPADRISSLVWALAGALAGTAAVLRASLIGSFHPAFMTLGLLQVFAAAVLGGLTSMPGALLGGIAIGIVESLASLWWGQIGGIAYVGVFGMLLLVLLVRPRGLLGGRA